MPFFHRKTDDEKHDQDERNRQLAEEQEIQKASLDSLQRGGIPIQAQRRLDELRQKGGFFTSDLSVNEFLLARQSGFHVLSQVMGSSIYHVGWQRLPVYYGSLELGIISEAMNHARQLALGRLAEEARRIGANAVIGVHVTRGKYDWAGDLIEFSTLGTAVRLEGAPSGGTPALTNLSGQDFWKLHTSGFRPLGVVAASMVYYVVASWQTQRAMGAWRQGNQELQDFTQGLYTARHRVMSLVRDQGSTLRAAGIVGMEIEQEEEEYEVSLGNDQERKDMIFTFHVMGTAIGESTQQAVAHTYAAINLS